MSRLAVDRRNGLAIWTGPTNQMQPIRIPEQFRPEFFQVFDQEPAKAYWIAQSILYSERAIRQASRSLRDLFGSTVVEIDSVVGDLLNLSGIGLQDCDTVERFAGSLVTGLERRYQARPMDRRRELSERVFSNPVVTYVEAMGWSEFIKRQDVQELNRRYNESEDSIEILYRFMDRCFLLANCGTGDIVLLPVGSVESCEQAQAWLAGDTVPGNPLPKFFSLGRT